MVPRCGVIVIVIFHLLHIPVASLQNNFLPYGFQQTQHLFYSFTEKSTGDVGDKKHPSPPPQHLVRCFGEHHVSARG